MSQASQNRFLEHVLITGAASGIGKACALKLQAQGVRLTVLDIIKPDFNVDQYQALDLSDLASIDSAIEFVKTIEPIDSLMNVAGVPPRPSQQAKVLNINWLGQVRLTEGVLNSLNSGGSIVNMASRAGGRWLENLEQVKQLMAAKTPAAIDEFLAASGIDATRAYNLSKEAMIVWSMGATQTMKARELRMNSVSPAAVDTAILDDFKTAFGPLVEKNLALVGRAGTAQEIAEVAVFLASPASHWLQGIDIVVDGGMGAMIQSAALELGSPS